MYFNVRSAAHGRDHLRTDRERERVKEKEKEAGDRQIQTDTDRERDIHYKQVLQAYVMTESKPV